MKIALVYRHFNTAGSMPRIQVELARYLVRRGHETHIYSMAETTDRALVPDCVYHAVPVSRIQTGARWSARELWSYARNAARLVSGETFDCVYTRLPGTWVGDFVCLGGVSVGESRRSGIGRFRRVASLARHPGDAARVAIERRAVRASGAWRYHVDSSQVADDLIAAHGVSRERISVIPPGIDLSEFKPHADRALLRQELDLPLDETLILFCGHDFRRKGLDRAVRALAAMRERAMLLVVGRRDETPYARLAAQLGVADRVRFCGARTDAERFFGAADIFALPTRAEMWGMTVVEAMATGLPAIVTEVAGVADIVTHGKTGFVVHEPFSVVELARTLDSLSASPELRARVGAAARKRVEGLSWDIQGRQIEAEIEEFVRRPGRVEAAAA